MSLNVIVWCNVIQYKQYNFADMFIKHVSKLTVANFTLLPDENADVAKHSSAATFPSLLRFFKLLLSRTSAHCNYTITISHFNDSNNE